MLSDFGNKLFPLQKAQGGSRTALCSAAAWRVTHRSRGAAASQTDREDKNSQTCCTDPSLKAVVHLLTSTNEKHTTAAEASIFPC